MEKRCTIAECLGELGVGLSTFSGCASTQDGWGRIKKAYQRSILQSHPDKGGTEEKFRSVQSAWGALRELYESGKVSDAGFEHYFGAGSHDAADMGRAPGGPRPSYEWFAEAAASEVPGYRVEVAKSGRSECVSKPGYSGCSHDEPQIEAGTVRFGSLDPESGRYGRWCAQSQRGSLLRAQDLLPRSSWKILIHRVDSPSLVILRSQAPHGLRPRPCNNLGGPRAVQGARRV